MKVYALGYNNGGCVGGSCFGGKVAIAYCSVADVYK